MRDKLFALDIRVSVSIICIGVDIMSGVLCCCLTYLGWCVIKVYDPVGMSRGRVYCLVAILLAQPLQYHGCVGVECMVDGD